MLEAEKLQRFGVTQQDARQIFQAAQQQVPRLQELQRRGGRAVSEEDIFELEEFTEAGVYKDPEEIEQIKMLEAEEKSRCRDLKTNGRRDSATRKIPY